MAFTEKPRLDLAKKVLPASLYGCLEYIFSKPISGLALCGGTALSGFYAGHRRSDDLDLFTKDEAAQEGAVRLVKSLNSIGVQFLEEFHTAAYYKATCQKKDHRFTVDVVWDPHLFQVGHFEVLSNGIQVADLDTLLMTKAATLVSRCSEKDLYDLMWLFDHHSPLEFKGLIELGKKIDQGVNGETVLLSVSGALLHEDACHFSQTLNAKEIFKSIKKFQKEFIVHLSQFLKDQSSSPLKEIIKKIKQFDKS